MKVLGIAGVATCGKDTFFNSAKILLENANIQSKRFAFADPLKSDICSFIQYHLSIDIYNMSSDEKAKVRPLLVAYGGVARSIDENFWVNKIKDEMDKTDDTIYKFVTDVRFPNEVDFIHSLGGKVLHIQRVCGGKILPPANNEESINDPIVMSKSDLRLVWESFDDGNVDVNLHVLNCLKELSICD